MQNNVAIVIFNVESEAFQAFNELYNAPSGEGYFAPEAALIRNKDGVIELCDNYGNVPVGTDTSKGIVIGSLVGLLGGPIGVILGASLGAQASAAKDTSRAIDNASVVAVVASIIYEGEIAIAALVGEDEPAFDNAFAKYDVTIIRYDAAEIADDVDRLYELEAEISNQVIEEVKADRKVARQQRREDRRARIKAQLEEYSAATNRAMGEVTPM